MASIEIRKETEADQAAISDVTESAFRGKPYAGGDEQDVIDRLRSSGALALSLVAVDQQAIVGQITFSPAQLAGESVPWYALGPVAVDPERQGQGIGSALINEGLKQIKEMGGLGCLLTGNPDYYSRFGFKASPSNCPVNEAPVYFQLKLLQDDQPIGRFSFHKAFYGE